MSKVTQLISDSSQTRTLVCLKPKCLPFLPQQPSACKTNVKLQGSSGHHQIPRLFQWFSISPELSAASQHTYLKEVHDSDGACVTCPGPRAVAGGSSTGPALYRATAVQPHPRWTALLHLPCLACKTKEPARPSEKRGLGNQWGVCLLRSEKHPAIFICILPYHTSIWRESSKIHIQ